MTIPRIRLLAAAGGAVLALAACHSPTTTDTSNIPKVNSTSAKAALHSAAANPTVRADTSQAAADAEACLHSGQTKTGAETCLTGLVPKGQRHALYLCAGKAWAGDHGQARQVAVQACVNTALAAAQKAPK